MKKIKKVINDNLFIIVVSIISILIVFSPNLMQNVIIGSDYPFHLARIETLAFALGRGEFPVKVHTDLAYGFGYGVGFFYSNFFLYIPAILMNLGFSLEVSYMSYIITLMGTIGLILYGGVCLNPAVRKKRNSGI